MAASTTRIEILDVFASARDADGVLRYYGRGDTVEVHADDAKRLVDLGAAQPVSGKRSKAAASSGSETGGAGSGSQGDGVPPASPPAPPATVDVEDKEAVMKALDAAGIQYDGRLGVAKLAELLPPAAPNS
jgi:hypothetical protein